MSKIKEKIKTHGLILLCLYGVKEKKVKDNPEVLNAFIKCLYQDIINLIK